MPAKRGPFVRRTNRHLRVVRRSNFSKSQLYKKVPEYTFRRWVDTYETINHNMPSPPLTADSEYFLTMPGSGFSSCVFDFKLNQLVNANEFVDLFDWYKFLKIEVFVSNKIQDTSANLQRLTMYSVIDTNDNTPPPSLAVMKQYQNCKMHQWNDKSVQKKKFSIAPTLLSESDVELTGQDRSPYVNTVSSGKTYLGLKLGFINNDSLPQHLFVNVRYTLKFKVPK